MTPDVIIGRGGAYHTSRHPLQERTSACRLHRTSFTESKDIKGLQIEADTEHTSMSQPSPRQQSTRNGSASRSPSVASSDGEYRSAGERRRRNRRRGGKRAEIPPVAEEDDGRAVANRGGEQVNKNQGNGGGGGDGKNTLGLRLDLNLDVDIHLTAKIHGDLTLSLL